MISIISGSESYLINKKIEEMIKDHSDAQISRFNGLAKNFSVTEMLEACMDVGIFASRTLVLVRDPSFFINKVNEDDCKRITEYCNEPLYECDLVFYTLDEAFNERLKVYKDVAKNAQVIKYSQLKGRDFYNRCLDILKERSISFNREVTSMLVNSSNNSLEVFSQNVSVLSLYPDNVNREVVENLLIQGDIDNVYLLINALTNKQISKSMDLLDKLLKYDGSVIGIVSLLAIQLRFLYEVHYYDEKGLSVEEIMDKVHTSSRYRIERAFEALSHLKEREMLNLLSRLADLDHELKTKNDIDDRLRFELFIVSLLGDSYA